MSLTPELVAEALGLARKIVGGRSKWHEWDGDSYGVEVVRADDSESVAGVFLEIYASYELQRAEIERLNSRIQEIAASHQSNTESLLEVARERDAMKAELAVANEAAVFFRDKATDVEVLRRNDAAERARLTTERDEARLRREMSLEHAQAAIATVRNDVPE